MGHEMMGRMHRYHAMEDRGRAYLSRRYSAALTLKGIAQEWNSRKGSYTGARTSRLGEWVLKGSVYGQHV
jgi:hypothetical protein